MCVDEPTINVPFNNAILSSALPYLRQTQVHQRGKFYGINLAWLLFSKEQTKILLRFSMIMVIQCGIVEKSVIKAMKTCFEAIRNKEKIF